MNGADSMDEKSITEDAGADAQVSHTMSHPALDVPELLEEILTHLPTKDLLFAQAVCSTWKNCIEGSIRLQQGLFFQIPKDKPPTDLAEALLHRFPPRGEESGVDKTPNIQSTAVNPLLRRVFDKKALVQIYMEEPMAEPHLSLAMQRPEASWRRMHFCYPEVTRVNIDFATLPMTRIEVFMGTDCFAMATVRPDVFQFMGDEMVSWMQEFETTSQLESHYADPTIVEELAEDADGDEDAEDAEA